MKKIQLLLILLLLISCSPQASSSLQSPVSSATSTSFVTPPLEPIAFTPAPGAHIGDSVPTSLRQQAQNLDLQNYTLDASPFVESNPSLSETKIQWVYALVAPFPTVADGVTFDQLLAVWTDGALLNGKPLLMEESTRDALTVLWDAPASPSVRIVSTGELLDQAWSESAWAIIPFEELQPKWKVLTIDGQSPIRKSFDLSTYPLVVDFTLQSSTNSLIANSLISNYDPSKLTTVILT
ncbi:MAG TPA: hypothetical protein PLF41_06460, partial [Anaerolineales bacterium]|nr:hypothetical protein [Anaerolineales bacterium]